MAYGAGQFAKLQEISGRFPYWQYSTANDERVRDSHRALEGKIFKASDSQYYPPIGFNCRCRAIPVSQREAIKRGITGPDIVTPEMRGNLQNAEFIGDKVGNFSDWLTKKMETLPPETQQMIRKKLEEVATFAPEQIQNLPVEPIDPKRLVEVNPTKSDADYINIFLDEFGASIGTPAPYTDVTKTSLVISEEFFNDRATGTYKIDRGRASYVKLLADTIKNPDEIWETTRESGTTKHLYIKAYLTGKGTKRYILIVSDKKGKDWVGTTAFYSKDSKYIEKQRKGQRIYKK